jgi:hypothetical protein
VSVVVVVVWGVANHAPTHYTDSVDRIRATRIEYKILPLKVIELFPQSRISCRALFLLLILEVPLNAAMELVDLRARTAGGELILI